MFRFGEQAITHVQGCRRDLNQYSTFQGYKLDNTTHVGPKDPRVAIIHDTVKGTIRAHLTLVHVFHAYALVDTPWVAHALSNYTPVRYGRIASVSAAHDATQFGSSISRMRHYISNACSFGPNRRGP
jgi:hypothetical protein